MTEVEMWTPSGWFYGMGHGLPAEPQPESVGYWLELLLAQPVSESWLGDVGDVALTHERIGGFETFLLQVYSRLGEQWRYGALADKHRADILPWKGILESRPEIDKLVLEAWLDGVLSKENGDRCLAFIQGSALYGECIRERLGRVNVLAWDSRWVIGEPVWRDYLPHLGWVEWVPMEGGLYLRTPLKVERVLSLEGFDIVGEGERVGVWVWDSGVCLIETEVHVYQVDDLRPIQDALCCLQLIAEGGLSGRGVGIVEAIVEAFPSWRGVDSSILVRMRVALDKAVDYLDSPELDALLVKLDVSFADYPVPEEVLRHFHVLHDLPDGVWWGFRK